jgi:hypothetical protein
MRRCKLISPTNLLLEHPILSPVEENEYVLFGVKEYEKFMRERLIMALLAGALAVRLVEILAQ